MDEVSKEYKSGPGAEVQKNYTKLFKKYIKQWGRAQVRDPFKRFWNFSTSLKFAILIILSFIGICIVGTFYESWYNAEVAKAWIYQSKLFWGILGLLAYNLICVMISRWPWRMKHLPFLLAHIGIVVILIGSVITYVWGVDGSLRLTPKEPANSITLPQKVLSVYAHFGDGNYRPVFETKVHFLKHFPKGGRSYSVGDRPLVLSSFCPFCLEKNQLVEDAEGKGWGVRLSLKNSQADWSDQVWISHKKGMEKRDLGPLTLVFSKKSQPLPEVKNQIIFSPYKHGLVL